MYRNNIFKLIFFYVIFILSIPTGLCAEKAFSQPWLNLLYYEKDGDGYKSLADGQNFFITPTGKTDPAGEYQESLALTQVQDENFRRTFPLRYKRLTHWHKISYQPLVETNPNITGLTLAYPNRYLKNPSSMFGHLIVILQSKRGLMDSKILHYIADTARSNPKYYVINGLGGKFKGWFLSEPYFKKIKDYAYLEDREIIYYDMLTTPQQVEDIQLHEFELQQTFFNYYFIDQNCAFFIGKMLNAVLGDQVIKHHRYTVPSNVIMAFREKGYLRQEYHRPSSTEKFNALYPNLSPSERKNVLALLTTRDAKVPSNPKVSETFLTISEHILNNSTNLTQIIRENRIRAYKHIQNEGSAQVRPIFIKKSTVDPILSRSLQVAYGLRNQYELSYRPVYYSDYESVGRLDVKKLSVGSSRIVMGPWQPTQAEFTLVDLVSYTPYTHILQPKSWKLQSQIGVRDSIYSHHKANFGRTFLLTPKTLAFGFWGGSLSNYNQLLDTQDSDLHLYPELIIGVTQQLGASLKGTVSYEHRYNDDYYLGELKWKSFGLFHALSYVHTDIFEGLKISSTHLF